MGYISPRAWVPVRHLHLDHEPAHVHVNGAGLAKINLLGPLGTPELVYSIGIKRSDLRRLMAEAERLQKQFLAEWERIHGPSQ